MKTLHQITSNLVVKQEGEQRPLAVQTNNVGAGPVAAGGSPTASRAVHTPDTVPQKRPEINAASIVEDFGNAARCDTALGNARTRLQMGGEDFWGELFLALQNLLFNPDPASRPASSEPYIKAMLALPETYVAVSYTHLTLPTN